MNAIAIGILMGLVFGVVVLFPIVWGSFAIAAARRRKREGERYIPFRELLAPRRPSFGNRLFDWFNETADRLVRHP